MNQIVFGHLPLGAALLGVGSHIAVFIRGEWHMRVSTLIKIYSFLTIALLYVEYALVGDFSASIRAVGSIIGSYAASLFGSIIIYRRYFHRLRTFPGPPLAAITKFWHVWKSSGGKNHLVVEELFKRYGSIIRTGPEELTIIDAAIPHIIDSPKSQFTKATFYDVLLPVVAISATRSVGDHDARRRIWNQGFSPKALASYENLILRYAKLLADQIESELYEKDSTTSSQGAVINVTDWFSWFAFDVMGEFAFSRSFQMLQDKKWHSKIRLLVDGMNAGNSLALVPWLAQLGKSIRPRMSLVKDWDSMLQWCRECMDERLQMRGERHDLSRWLIDAYVENGSQQTDLAWLHGDAVTIIVAGSGTVSVGLTFAFYQLAHDPSQQEKLFNEIKDVDIYDRGQIQNCSHLTAFINETLRLHPPVPTGGHRVTPPSGITINNKYIPGGVTIMAPKYSIQRLESSYENADQFIPERWTVRPDLVKDNRGFAPFSQGKFSCLGKPLAMIEMRLVISSLLKKFKIEFQGNDGGQTLFADLEDHFTFTPGDLHLRFRMRSSASG
ncbi:cytochrome P450 [Ustulina deusta]|nr:cytochrome P450 [Ustulina deusta]